MAQPVVRFEDAIQNEHLIQSVCVGLISGILGHLLAQKGMSLFCNRYPDARPCQSLLPPPVYQLEMPEAEEEEEDIQSIMETFIPTKISPITTITITVDVSEPLSSTSHLTTEKTDAFYFMGYAALLMVAAGCLAVVVVIAELVTAHTVEFFQENTISLDIHPKNFACSIHIGPKKLGSKLATSIVQVYDLKPKSVEAQDIAVQTFDALVNYCVASTQTHSVSTSNVGCQTPKVLTSVAHTQTPVIIYSDAGSQSPIVISSDIGCQTEEIKKPSLQVSNVISVINSKPVSNSALQVSKPFSTISTAPQNTTLNVSSIKTVLDVPPKLVTTKPKYRKGIPVPRPIGIIKDDHLDTLLESSRLWRVIETFHRFDCSDEAEYRQSHDKLKKALSNRIYLIHKADSNPQ
jgi:hypothetical protein